MSNENYENCTACSAPGWSHEDGGPCCGSERSAWLEGIAEGRRRERADVAVLVTDMLGSLARGGHVRPVSP